MYINCKEKAQQIKEELKNKIDPNNPPILTIVQVGDNPASNSYIKGKVNDCKEVGIAYNHYKFDDSIPVTTGYDEHYDEWVEIDEFTLCQCTGLKDKVGNLIWENDVVIYCDCTEERCVIAWEENKACFEYQQYGYSIMNFDELSGVEVEVIGSIFDNPELLEVERF